MVGTSRTVIAMADATRVLHEFACWCAERVLRRCWEAGQESDPRYWKAIEVKRAWLAGKATDEELATVREDLAAAALAVWKAESAATWRGTIVAAGAVTKAIENDISWMFGSAAAISVGEAVKTTAWKTALATASSATVGIDWIVKKEAQNTQLGEMLFDLLGIDGSESTKVRGQAMREHSPVSGWSNEDIDERWSLLGYFTGFLIVLGCALWLLGGIRCGG